MTTSKKTTASGRASRKPKARYSNSGLYLDNDVYAACIDGLRDQGIDHKEAVETLRIGMRQANGRPVPLELLGTLAANSDSVVDAA